MFKDGQIIVYVLMVAMVIAAVDRMLGGKLGLGKKYEEAFYAMGPLALSMAGIMVSSDIIGELLVPSVGRVFTLLGGDACMAGSLILSLDTGAYTLAHSISPENPDTANFSAVFLASMMGPTIAFNIPLALTLMKKEDHPLLALGALCSILFIPIGCLAGGLLAGFAPGLVLANSIPVLLFSGLIAMGLLFFPGKMIRLFCTLSHIMLFLLTGTLTVAVLQENTSLHLVRLRPLSEVWLTVGMIAAMLAGAYPFMTILSRLIERPMKTLGIRCGLEGEALTAMLAAMVSSIPALSALPALSAKGKVTTIAFTCCACFALGDYLGFCAGVEPQLIIPMITGKLIAGVLAAFVAGIICDHRNISHIVNKSDNRQ